MKQAAAWFAVAVIGQAASLRLVEAGPLLHYQHVAPLGSLASNHPWLLAIVAAQGAAVAIALVGRAVSGNYPASAAFRIPRIAAALLLSVCSAATVSSTPSRYIGELALAAGLQLVAIGTIVLVVLAVPSSSLDLVSRAFSRVFGAKDGNAAAERPRLDGVIWSAAAFAVIAATVLNVFSYERHPHVPDEVGYLLHARYFAEGMWTMPAPPVPAAFDVDLMNVEAGRWFSPVPPAWPAVLALGVRAGAPWLVNPMLAGLNVLLSYLLVTELYPRRVARWAAVLLSVSPWFLFLGMSFMTQMLTLTLALVAALGVVYARRAGSFGWGMVAGAAVGAMDLVRPLDAVVVGALMALWSIGIGGRRLRVPALVGLALGTIVFGALTFPYNRMLTGDPLKFPINAYTDKYRGVNSNAYGFGADRGMGWPIDPNPGHGPVDGLINTNLNAFGLNTDLFGWSTGSLILAALLLCGGRLTRSDWLMISTTIAVVAAYFFYYFSGGPDFGARYWFVIVVPLVALTARGIEELEAIAGARAGLAVAALVAMTLVNYLPWRATDKYHHFRGMRADVRALAKTNGFGHDLVLVRGERFPDYASAAVYNPVNLADASTVYAWDRNGEVRAATLAVYPDRRVWLVDGPSITGAGYRIAGGPLSQASLLSDETGR